MESVITMDWNQWSTSFGIGDQDASEYADTNKGTNKSRRNEHLVVEIEGLKNKLAQAQAIIDLQKKVSELLGT